MAAKIGPFQPRNTYTQWNQAYMSFPRLSGSGNRNMTKFITQEYSKWRKIQDGRQNRAILAQKYLYSVENQVYNVSFPRISRSRNRNMTMMTQEWPPQQGHFSLEMLILSMILLSYVLPMFLWFGKLSKQITSENPMRK